MYTLRKITFVYDPPTLKSGYLAYMHSTISLGIIFIPLRIIMQLDYGNSILALECSLFPSLLTIVYKIQFNVRILRFEPRTFKPREEALFE